MPQCGTFGRNNGGHGISLLKGDLSTGQKKSPGTVQTERRKKEPQTLQKNSAGGKVI